jgi:hypothetical protein
MDFRFVIKTMMADHPLRVLIVFTVSFWICMSWMFTQCERWDSLFPRLHTKNLFRYDGKVAAEHYYLNAMWFIMVGLIDRFTNLSFFQVTFMSIGYGDIVPRR